MKVFTTNQKATSRAATIGVASKVAPVVAPLGLRLKN